MKIHYLGTAAAEGIPAIFCACPICMKARAKGEKNNRTRTQIIIDETIIIDFPPDSLIHAQRNSINFLDCKAIFVTHSHQDHWYPDDLLFRKPPYSWGAENPLQIFGNRAVKEKLDTLALHKDPDLSQSIKMDYILPFTTIEIGDYRVTPLLATHDNREQCYIYMIEKEGRRFLYAHDTGQFPEITNRFIKGIYFDAISMDCTMGSLKDGKNHMGIVDNHELRKNLQRIGCLDNKTQIIISHFSHNGGLLHEELQDSVKKDGYIVAYDGMVIEC